MEKTPATLVYSIGNPGAAYRYTRHSVGHLVLEMIRNDIGSGPWQNMSSYRKAQVSRHDEYPIDLFMSQSMMNDSGSAVSKNWAAWSRERERNGYAPQLVVLHDELSLPVGRIQMRSGSASARGHNGLRSIQQKVRTDYATIAIGIGRPIDTDPGDYVLGRIPQADLATIEHSAVPKVVELLNALLEGQ